MLHFAPPRAARWPGHFAKAWIPSRELFQHVTGIDGRASIRRGTHCRNLRLGFRPTVVEGDGMEATSPQTTRVNRIRGCRTTRLLLGV